MNQPKEEPVIFVHLLLCVNKQHFSPFGWKSCGGIDLPITLQTASPSFSSEKDAQTHGGL